MGEETEAETGTKCAGLIGVLKPVGHLCVACFLFYTSHVMVMPFMVDILLNALCPGETECSIVILMSGTLELVTGLGAIVMAPILGNISDKYGRRPVLLLVLCSAIVPAALLGYSRAAVVVYIWYGAYAIASVIKYGGLIPVLLAYVADVVDDRRRAIGVSVVMGCLSTGFLVGTVTAYALKYNYQAFRLSAGIQILCSVYVVIFLKESYPRVLLPAPSSQSESTMRLLAGPELKRQRSSFRQTAKTVSKSWLLRRLALVDFLHSFGFAGLNSFSLYFLKSVFNYGKDEFATVVLISGICAAVGQMFFYPTLVSIFQDRGALWIVLLGASLHYLGYGFAWAPWVPYLASSMGLFSACVQPAMGTIVSKAVHPDEQGTVQGFMSSIRSVASITAPLVLTPLTALALGKNPPFKLPGLPFIICGSLVVLGWVVSLGLPAPKPEGPKSAGFIHAPVPPESAVRVPAPEGLLQVPTHSEILNGTLNGGNEKS